MTINDEEIWVVSPSLPVYEVSNHGRVRKIPHEKPMPHGGVRTYGGEAHYGGLRKDKVRRAVLYKGKNYYIHRLVCEAFHGPAPGHYPEYVCVHLDENGLNNRADNLAW